MRGERMSEYVLADAVEILHAEIVALLAVPRLVNCISEGEGGLRDVLRVVVLRVHVRECVSLSGSGMRHVVGLLT